LQERPLKKEARVLGIDDGPYVRGSGSTNLVMTVYRLDGHIEGFITGEITTDGDDSADRIADILNGSRFHDQVRCIISDGACLAGFNVLDMDRLHDSTGIPVITTSDETPRTDRIESALRSHFEDWRRRLELITRHGPHELKLPDGICFVREKGISPNGADDIVKRATIQGRTPEPVRISHMVATAIHKESGR
jgi:endonuclease V-like protein UPF0215 family